MSALSQELADREAEERDAWTRFAAGATQRQSVENEREAAIWADLLLDEWRARWGREEGEGAR